MDMNSPNKNDQYLEIIKVHKNYIQEDNFYSDEVGLFKEELDDNPKEGSLNMKTLLVDPNLILDVLLNRECPSLEDSVALIDLISSGFVKGCITRRGLDDIVLLTETLQEVDGAARIGQKLLGFLQVCEVDDHLILEARQMSLPDFDSTIQLACALRHKLDAIVTLKSDDFWGDETPEKNIPVFTPTQFLNYYYGFDVSSERDLEQADNIDSEFLEKLEKSFDTDGVFFEELLDEKLSLGMKWILAYWVVRCAQDNFAEATVMLRNPETSEQRTAFARAKGPIDASCQALDSLVEKVYEPLKYSFKDFSTRNFREEGAAAPVKASVVVKCGDSTYTSEYIHRNMIKAVFYAYTKSVDKILKGGKADPDNVRPEVEVVPSSEMNGAVAAFEINNKTIYLSDELVSQEADETEEEFLGQVRLKQLNLKGNPVKAVFVEASNSANKLVKFHSDQSFPSDFREKVTAGLQEQNPCQENSVIIIAQVEVICILKRLSLDRRNFDQQPLNHKLSQEAMQAAIICCENPKNSFTELHNRFKGDATKVFSELKTKLKVAIENFHKIELDELITPENIGYILRKYHPSQSRSACSRC